MLEVVALHVYDVNALLLNAVLFLLSGKQKLHRHPVILKRPLAREAEEQRQRDRTAQEAVRAADERRDHRAHLILVPQAGEHAEHDAGAQHDPGHGEHLRVTPRIAAVHLPRADNERPKHCPDNGIRQTLKQDILQNRPDIRHKIGDERDERVDEMLQQISPDPEEQELRPVHLKAKPNAGERHAPDHKKIRDLIKEDRRVLAAQPPRRGQKIAERGIYGQEYEGLQQKLLFPRLPDAENQLTEQDLKLKPDGKKKITVIPEVYAHVCTPLPLR